MKQTPLMLIALLSLVGMTRPANAQDMTQWDAVRQIAAGQELRVELRNKQKHSGFVVAVTDTEIKLEKEGDVLTLRQPEIKKVWHITNADHAKQRLFRSIGIGASVFAGLAVAVLQGFKQCGKDCNAERTGIAAAVIGLPIAGGVIGQKLAGSGKRRLIYANP